MAFEGLTEKLSNAFKKLRGKGRLSEADVKESMREIRLALLEADVNYKVVKDFIKKTTGRCVGTDVLESLTPAQMIVKIVNEELTALMGSENQKLKIASQPPTVVMLVGLQGAGKTTNGAKLAGLFKKQNKDQAAAGRRRTAGNPCLRDGADEPGRYRQGRRCPRRPARQRHGLPRYGRPPACR